MKYSVLFVAAMVSGAAQAATSSALPSDRQALFGELHLHTGFSMDAISFEGAMITPDQAFRFGRGDEIDYMGGKIRRREPLDFMAVTDHAENMGVAYEFTRPETAAGQSDLGLRFRDWLTKRDHYGFAEMFGIAKNPPPGVDPKAIVRSAWQRMIDAVKQNYIPGKFTTLLGYEWTAATGGPDLYQNLHRNVIFRGTDAPVPFSANDSVRPEDLWHYLEENRKRGVEALAIPHNGNVSNGLMYDWVDSDGKPITKAYALRRALNEPLTEIVQTKGQSETDPILSPNDEYANFEVYETLLTKSIKGKPHGSYIREAYGRGLVIEARTGANPYQYGVVGGSDLHGGLSDSHEDTFYGEAGAKSAAVPSETEAAEILGLEKAHLPSQVVKVELGSAGLTGVWADANTREEIYDALRRKETFATSGNRIKVRFFGGWADGAAILKNGQWVKAAYAQDVAMGGNLPNRPSDARAPNFLIWALKDPSAANLDRVQVVKVWLEGDDYREKIFDAAVAAGKLQEDHKSGNTEFLTTWSDPEFDATKPSLYYVRVLEVPTLRWSTRLAARYNLSVPKDVPPTIQERAWSSPIWYMPSHS
jgi:hypothetical protein